MPASAQYQPDEGKLLLAFIAAPFVAALLFPLPWHVRFLGTSDFQIGAYFMAFSVACIFALPLGAIFGLPVYLFLRRKGVRPTLLNCVIAGGVVAALPFLVVLSWNVFNHDVQWLYSARHFTRLTLNLFHLFMSGCVAGFVFWFIVVFRDRRLYKLLNEQSA